MTICQMAGACCSGSTAGYVSTFPKAILISEDLRNFSAMTGDPHTGGTGFHAQWDANFVHPVRAAVITPEDGQRSMDAVRDAVLNRYNGDAFRRVVYSESHDEVANGKARVPQEIDGNDATGWFARKRSTLAAALVMTARASRCCSRARSFSKGSGFATMYRWTGTNNKPFAASSCSTAT